MKTSLKTNSRFIQSIVTTARDAQTQMPWERGATRLAMIARRRAALQSNLRSA